MSLLKNSVSLRSNFCVVQQFKKAAFYTLGCKLNFSETSTISRLFENAGYAKVDFEESPDILVINTCSVTENADKKCVQLVRRAKKVNPDVFIAVIGCYAQLKPQEIASIPGVSLVLGANEKFDIIQHLEKESSLDGVTVSQGNIKQVTQFIPGHSYGDRTRSFLKVQDGCDYFCTFCTIPLARGKSRNASIAKTVEEAQKIAATEIQEVVLTGVNIGDFGQGGPQNFYQLVRALDQVAGIERFRISSIEPNLLSDEIIDFTLTESHRFVPHFHIPLQSGSNDLLKAMRRKYLRELYADKVRQIKTFRPDCCIGVDVIVGFPGETDEHFAETMNFLSDLEVSYLHVFTYSERANTTAVKLGNPVPQSVRKERSRQLHILSEKKKRAFYESQLGSLRTVLWEGEEENGAMYGFTENYVKVKRAYQPELANTLQRIRLDHIDRDGIVTCSLITEEVLQKLELSAEG